MKIHHPNELKTVLCEKLISEFASRYFKTSMIIIKMGEVHQFYLYASILGKNLRLNF